LFIHVTFVLRAIVWLTVLNPKNPRAIDIDSGVRLWNRLNTFFSTIWVLFT